MRTTLDEAATEIEDVLFPAFVDAIKKEDSEFRMLVLDAHSRGQCQRWNPGAMSIYEQTLVYRLVKECFVRQRDFELLWEFSYPNQPQWGMISGFARSRTALSLPSR